LAGERKHADHATEVHIEGAGVNSTVPTPRKLLAVDHDARVGRPKKMRGVATRRRSAADIAHEIEDGPPDDPNDGERARIRVRVVLVEKAQAYASRREGEAQSIEDATIEMLALKMQR